MKFNLISNTNNGVGLQADCHLLRGLLTSWGHQAELVHYKRVDAGSPRADVNIFLETIASAMFPFAKQQWLIPNQEWFAPWDNNAIMQKMDKILCKTHDAVKIFKDLYPELQNRIHHIGFESRDLYDPDIPRVRKFLHVFGQSRYKSTPAVCYAFSKCDYQDEKLPLTIVGAYPEEIKFAEGSKNVTYHQRVSDSEMKQLLNSHLFAVVPSGAEGWGHVIHESLACGAIVLTMDFPPMNEFAGLPRELLVRYQRTIPELAAQRALTGALEIAEAVNKAIRLSQSRIDEISINARESFLSQRESFRKRFKDVVDGV
jgi:hypothetical protein